MNNDESLKVIAIKGRCKAGQLKRYGAFGFLSSIDEVVIG